MKLEHLKDCCVFVHNKSSVHFVLVKSLVQPPLLQPTSPRTRGLCFMSPSSRPFFGVNVWDQTLFSGCARVTLTTKTPRHRRQGKVTLQRPVSPSKTFWLGHSVYKVVIWTLFNGLPVFKLCCCFFLYGTKREKENLHLIYLHKCRKRILSKLLRKYRNVYFSTGWAGGGRFC